MTPQTSYYGEDEEVGEHVVQGAADVEVVRKIVFLLAEEVDQSTEVGRETYQETEKVGKREEEVSSETRSWWRWSCHVFLGKCGVILGYAVPDIAISGCFFI